MNPTPAVSVIVPLFNEAESVGPLVKAVTDALADAESWELVLVDDGSRDTTAELAQRAAEADPRVRLLRLARNYGQTPAMQAGFDHARASVVVTMDGDLQNDPRDIPRLMAELDKGYDLVAGYRERRQDAFLRRKVPSWVANRIIAWATGIQIRDNGCSLKAYRREVVRRLQLYSDLHRFIPAVAAATSGARIAQIPVRHHARQFGRSKYGLSRIAKVLADLLTITMIRHFRERPLLLFALAAAASALFGLLYASAGVIGFFAFARTKASAIVFSTAGLLWLALACYLAMLGLIGEVALRNARNASTDLARSHGRAPA